MIGPAKITWRCQRCGFEETTYARDVAKAVRDEDKMLRKYGKTPHECADGEIGALVLVKAEAV